MTCVRFLPAVLLVPLLLTTPAASAQTKRHKKAVTATKTTTTTTSTTKTVAAVPKGPVIAESLSGLDLMPDRQGGTFAVRISKPLTQSATMRLTDTQSSRILRTELLEPNGHAVRAVQVGKLPNGEYKMEVLLPDTVYWKTVKVTHTRSHAR